MLGELEGFHAAGELIKAWKQGFLSNNHCGCGMPVSSCPFWKQVLERAFGPGMAGSHARINELSLRHPVAASPPLRLLTTARRSPGRTTSYDTETALLYRALQELTECQIVVDSSKSIGYAEHLNDIPELDVHVLHLVRDPRGTAYSWLRKKRVSALDDQMMLVQSPATTARRWLKTQMLAELLWKSRTGRYHRMRYEDLMRDPAGNLRVAAQLVGENPRQLPLEGPSTVRLREMHTAAGNPNRFSNGAIFLRVDDEWISGMRTQDQLTVTAITLPLILRYGYRLNAQPGGTVLWR